MARVVAYRDRRVGAVAIGVGRIVPELTHGARWPFRVLGIVYGLIAVAVLVIGAVRQQRTADALRRGSYVRALLAAGDVADRRRGRRVAGRR